MICCCVDIQGCVEAIVHVREIITVDMRSPSSNSSPRLLLALYQSIRMLRNMLERDMESGKSLVSLVKGLLRSCRNDMLQYQSILYLYIHLTCVHTYILIFCTYIMNIAFVNIVHILHV